MTTTYSEGEEPKVIKICKKHNWIYIRNCINNEKETVDLLMCSKCGQKIVHFWDEPECKLIERTRKYLEENKKCT
ncbi:MAG: hypothetical protein PHS54_02910 [Clostridia bacterium]|nr:hypothetical protein [Clostridia bacterium]